MPPKTISAEITALPNQASQAAKVLQRMGFRILHIGPTISVQGSQALWESTFQVSFMTKKKTISKETGVENTYLKARMDTMHIPSTLEELITEVSFVEPPELFGQV